MKILDFLEFTFASLIGNKLVNNRAQIKFMTDLTILISHFYKPTIIL